MSGLAVYEAVNRIVPADFQLSLNRTATNESAEIIVDEFFREIARAFLKNQLNITVIDTPLSEADLSSLFEWVENHYGELFPRVELLQTFLIKGLKLLAEQADASVADETYQHNLELLTTIEARLGLDSTDLDLALRQALNDSPELKALLTQDDLSLEQLLISWLNYQMQDTIEAVQRAANLSPDDNVETGLAIAMVGNHGNTDLQIFSPELHASMMAFIQSNPGRFLPVVLLSLQPESMRNVMDRAIDRTRGQRDARATDTLAEWSQNDTPG